ncbi:MAG: hypothetical protein LUQ36_10345 [Methanoregula sp.]|nr:hypothetical protein [Methanoregula sp.]
MGRLLHVLKLIASGTPAVVHGVAILPCIGFPVICSDGLHIRGIFRKRKRAPILCQ